MIRQILGWQPYYNEATSSKLCSIKKIEYYGTILLLVTMSRFCKINE